MSKNTYEEGTPEYEAFNAGAESERIRLKKVLEKYHQTFGKGDITQSDSQMQIRYLYDYVAETRSLK